jgi:hypothetical protein
MPDQPRGHSVLSHLPFSCAPFFHPLSTAAPRFFCCPYHSGNATTVCQAGVNFVSIFIKNRVAIPETIWYTSRLGKRTGK